ncbi:MAG: flagellar hook assembly protein FlgD [Deltaproteobacteria bacterium]|nr:flagellar hook assembly protein FlgD [Deltaproteobacteria bacterium]
MSIANVTGPLYDPTQSSPSEAVTRTSKDEFLRLLVAQLQQQDPLSPQDGAEFVAQLAQFASVEQLAESNQRLASIEAAQAAGARAGYAELVGRVVSVRTDEIALPLSEDGQTVLSAHLDSAASSVEVSFFDSSGREVRKLNLGARGAGDVEVAWDGRDEDGILLPDGQYTVKVHATASGGSPLSAYAQVRGVVDSLMFEGGIAQFKIGSMTVSPGDIMSVHR